MRTLFALNGNLLAETTFYIDKLEEGATLRAKSARFQAGGKGVNVCKAAKLLGMSPYAVIFPAGNAGKACVDFIKLKKFAKVIAVKLLGETRLGLIAKTPNSETTVLGTDLPVSPKDFAKALSAISKKAKKGDILAFCGSFPGWNSLYGAKLKALIKTKGLLLAADTYGEPLKFFAKEPAEILRINRAEFCGLAGLKIDAPQTAFERAFAKIAQESPAKIFAVSDGARALYMRCGGKIAKFAPPAVAEASATGAGDTMLAALIKLVIADEEEPFKAMALAVNLASASVKRDGIAEFSKAELNAILNAESVEKPA